MGFFKQGRSSAVYLHGILYKNKTDVIKNTRRILHQYRLKTPITGDDFDFLLALFELHPESVRKFGPGVKSIQVRENATYRQKEFSIIRVDDEEWDMSFMSCINPPSRYTVFGKACRCAVTNQILQYKIHDQTNTQCVLTGELVDKQTCHVDHYNPEFQDLVLMFITDQTIDVKKVEYKEVPDIVDDGQVFFTDSTLAEDFAQFHALMANLRIVTKRANLTRKRGKRTFDFFSTL